MTYFIAGPSLPSKQGHWSESSFTYLLAFRHCWWRTGGLP